jgi:hypothetical protein
MLEYVGIGRYEQVERTGGWDWVEAEYGVRGQTRRPVVFVPDGHLAKMLREQLQVLSPDPSGEPETSLT